MALTTNAGALPLDVQANPVQVANRIVSRDGTTPTAQESPQTGVDDSTALELAIPENALELVLTIRTNTARVGDNSTLDGTANEGYRQVLVDETLTIPCANGSSVFVKADAALADTDVHFHFNTLALS
jgi:hypothetical protein